MYVLLQRECGLFCTDLTIHILADSHQVSLLLELFIHELSRGLL